MLSECQVLILVGIYRLIFETFEWRTEFVTSRCSRKLRSRLATSTVEIVNTAVQHVIAVSKQQAKDPRDLLPALPPERNHDSVYDNLPISVLGRCQAKISVFG